MGIDFLTYYIILGAIWTKVFAFPIYVKWNGTKNLCLAMILNLAFWPIAIIMALISEEL